MSKLEQKEVVEMGLRCSFPTQRYHSSVPERGLPLPVDYTERSLSRTNFAVGVPTAGRDVQKNSGD